MFDNKAEKYVPKHVNIMANYKKVQATKCGDCLKAGDITATIRESFRFIKEKEASSLEPPNNITILTGVWLQGDQSNYKNSRNVKIALITGIITKVCETYAELSYTNSSGDLIKTVVSYDGIIYFTHVVIYEYFEEYVAKISKFPPLCENKNDENYKVLERLSKLLEGSDNKRNFEFILGGVLTREFQATSIAIVRNLIILEEFFVIPITSISGFLQTGNCNV